ncbi:hypothetical protein BDN70DRAFT_925104 [Pholiota conissans]|uniref:NACHT domain-containing protein n=1 Tax=Pholiota conissans TaxID=109636 RepID=A0A9P6CU21_9AGAR|nr:hypothetical protein BDN70DRAFT_925104 [Pholiota conissans]
MQADAEYLDHPIGPLPFINHNGGYFTSVQSGGTMTVSQINATNMRDGLKLLLANISRDASYNSAGRGNPPKCHPHTREAVLRDIMQWGTSEAVAREKLIMWMYGPAGSGKTAIEQSIAEACAKKGFLVASFFFGRLASGRDTLAPVAATLAYQISRSIPEMEGRLLITIEKDPAIFSHSLSSQMNSLIIDPLNSIQLSIQPRIVIIDGVDECGPNDQAHKELLNVLGTTAHALRNIPILFLIASRPEYEIRTAFSKDLLRSITRSLILDDDYRPDDDIRVYLNDEFRRIGREREAPLGSTPWPPPSDVDLLVQKASGQFIFASTIIKYIGDPRHNPSERLKIVLSLSATGDETPFALLDSLYRSILSSVIDVKKVLQVLTWFILPEVAGMYGFNLEGGEESVSLDELLGFNARMAMLDMHALVFVSPLTKTELTMRFHHASLYDFLTDHSRSIGYYIDEVEGYEFLCRRRLNMVVNFDKSILLRSALRDAMVYFAYNCTKFPPGGQIFHQLSLRVVLESLYYQQRVGNPNDLPWRAFFLGIRRQADDATFTRLQNEFDSFFMNYISKYPAPIQSFIPLMIARNFSVYSIRETFHLILLGVSQSEVEFRELVGYDKIALVLMSSESSQVENDAAFIDLFTSRERAGKYLVNDHQLVMLVRRVIEAIFPGPEDISNYHRIRIDGIENKCFQYLGLDEFLFDDHWLLILFKIAPINVELAMFLHERALQYKPYIALPLLGREKSLTWKELATSSLRYIQRCKVPFLRHSHLPETTDCIICERFEDEAEVVDTSHRNLLQHLWQAAVKICPIPCPQR